MLLNQIVVAKCNSGFLLADKKQTIKNIHILLLPLWPKRQTDYYTLYVKLIL
jgi:hypothetical protein